jgi:hypothetical protein
MPPVAVQMILLLLKMKSHQAQNPQRCYLLRERNGKWVQVSLVFTELLFEIGSVQSSDSYSLPDSWPAV